MMSPLHGQTDHLVMLLMQRRAAILHRWTERIRWEHPDKHLTPGELQDHLPVFFDALIEALADVSESKTTVNDDRIGACSAEHGGQRLREGFDLTEVLREYQILTECVLDEVEDVAAPLAPKHLRRVLQLVDQGRAVAARTYVERRDHESARQQSQHVAFVAHEQRTPLMTAITALHVLRKTARQEDSLAIDLLSRSLNSLQELIDNVLTGNRLSSSLQVEREWIDLRDLLRELLADVRLAAEQRELEMIFLAPLPLPYQGDRRLLRSAFENLLRNAIKFSHERSKVLVRAERRTHALVIEVEDRCGGLNTANPVELFDPLVQRSRDRSGFGLGLAIAKQAVEAQGGSISIRDLPGSGCVFTVELFAKKTT